MISKELLDKLDCTEAPKRLIFGTQAEYAEENTDYANKIYTKGLKRNWNNTSEKDFSKKYDQNSKATNLGEKNKFTGNKSQGSYFKGAGTKKYLRTKDIVRHPMFGIGIILATNERTIKSDNLGKYLVSFPGKGEQLVLPSMLILVKPKEVSGGIRNYSEQQKVFKGTSNK